MFLKPMIEYQFHRFHVIFCFIPIFYHMNMNGFMIIGIKHKSKTKYDK